MPVQRRKLSGRAALVVMSATVWLGLAGCAGTATAPPAPQAPTTPGASDAWTVLSQSSRFAAATPGGAQAADGPKLMSPDEARAAVPFVFGMPAWVPPGFELQGQAEVIAPTTPGGLASVSLNWQNDAGATIELLIAQDAMGADLAGGGGQSEAIQIGGQPASLRQQTGFGAERLTLAWTSGSLSYRLAAESGATTRDELVRMAESVS